MIIARCKMCGGQLELTEGMSVIECEYCGSRQTVPNADNDKKMTLFARADRLRSSCEFDKAFGIYESIVTEYPEEAEAYWGLILCKYGIEYVDDAATGKKVPTCHRSSYKSIFEDDDLEQALENADVLAREVYRNEAKEIEELRKGIIEVSGKEEPYDVFICYKEADENGERTVDSVLAQEAYEVLVEKGYRVFFSRITLEDKLGQEYEPYIFAALNSSKVMLAFGTSYEHYNAVWVKNEWSRFLSMMAEGQKKTLIPCYKGIDAYDIPKEFSHLQAQDIGKVGAFQDLVRGIEKIIPRKKENEKSKIVYQHGVNIQNILKRGEIAIEDHEWGNAQKFYDKVLDVDSENSDAYFGLWMVKFQLDVSNMQERCWHLIREEKKPIYDDSMFKRAYRSGDKERQEKLDDLKKTTEYRLAKEALQCAENIEDTKKAKRIFSNLGSYKDSLEQVEVCKRKIIGYQREIEERKERKKKLEKNFKEEIEEFRKNFSMTGKCQEYLKRKQKYEEKKKIVQFRGILQPYHISLFALFLYIMHLCSGNTVSEICADQKYQFMILVVLVCFSVTRVLALWLDQYISDRTTSSLVDGLIIFFITLGPPVTGIIAGYTCSRWITDGILPETILQHEQGMKIATIVIAVIFLVKLIVVKKYENIADTEAFLLKDIREGCINDVKNSYMKICNKYKAQGIQEDQVDGTLEEIINCINSDYGIFSLPHAYTRIEIEMLICEVIYAVVIIIGTGIITYVLLNWFSITIEKVYYAYIWILAIGGGIASFLSICYYDEC